MTLYFADGRKISTLLEWYPRLLNATPKQRAKWNIIGADRGINWPEVDEDLSIEGILNGVPSVEYRRPKSISGAKRRSKPSPKHHEASI